MLDYNSYDSSSKLHLPNSSEEPSYSFPSLIPRCPHGYSCRKLPYGPLQKEREVCQGLLLQVWAYAYDWALFSTQEVVWGFMLFSGGTLQI